MGFLFGYRQIGQLLFDHSSTLASSNKKTVLPGSMEDHRALLLFSESQNGIVYMDIPIVREPFYHARETPALRGGVPPFEAGGMYLESALSTSVFTGGVLR